MVVFQSPFPSSAFLRLAESLIPSGMEGNISLRERIVRYKTLYCWAESP